MDDLLEVQAFPDHGGAANGLQVEGTRPVARIVSAVDASVRSIEAATARSADLLVVHHGLYWDGLRPLIGRSYARVAPLVRAGIALYSAHLPLDAHPEVGNAAVLLRALRLRAAGPFGRFQTVRIGLVADTDETRDALGRRVEEIVDAPVRVIPGGPERVRRLAVVTGGGSGFIREAAESGADTLLTGEGPHHSEIDATEYGVNVLFAGHYATETFGVRALGERVAAHFGIEHEFVALPPIR